jgi:hypothetical protein
MSENEPKLTPEAIKYLNKMAAQQGDAPGLSPQSIRFLNSRLEGLAAMQKIIPALFGLVIGAGLINFGLPAFAYNMRDLLTDKTGNFTLKYVLIQDQAWYSDTIQCFVMAATGFAIVAFIIFLLTRKPKSV